jgi:hypothetical protein
VGERAKRPEINPGGGCRSGFREIAVLAVMAVVEVVVVEKDVICR